MGKFLSQDFLGKFFKLTYLDAAFLMAIAYAFMPWAKTHMRPILVMCVYYIVIYVMVYMVRNIAFYFNRMLKPGRLQWLAFLLFAVTTLFSITFILKSGMTAGFDFYRIFAFKTSEDFYLWGLGVLYLGAAIMKDKFIAEDKKDKNAQNN
ncbi:MAG: hypothetical protein LRY57_01870 [Alphaproteobacteria bacterium]|nr:hypothetical protein [Alphaproteobacteria bacterium]